MKGFIEVDVIHYDSIAPYEETISIAVGNIIQFKAQGNGCFMTIFYSMETSVSILMVKHSYEELKNKIIEAYKD